MTKPQLRRNLALAAAIAALGLGANAWSQPTPAAPNSGGPTPSTSKSGGPVPGSGTMPAPATKSGPMGSKGSASALSADDRKFVENTAKGGMTEVEVSRVAQQKAQNAQVKEFAGRMVADHGKANDELKSLAANKGVALPADAEKDARKHADDMNKHSGAKFDHEYMEMMVKDHKKTIKDFEHASKNAKDSDLRAWAAKTLPTLQEHLKMAEAAQAAAKAK